MSANTGMAPSVMTEKHRADRRRGGDRASGHRVEGTIFPGRSFSPCRRSSSNGRSASTSRSAAGANETVTYADLVRVATEPRFAPYFESVEIRHRRRASGRAFRHRGLADLADHRLRLGCDRDPARRRDDPPRRMRGGARDRRRRRRSRRNRSCAFRCSPRCRRKTIRRSRPRNRFRRTATASCWRKERPRSCSRASSTRIARGAKILGIVAGLRREGGQFPPHPLEPGRQADHRLHAQRVRRRRHYARRHRLHQRPRHLDAGKRQDGDTWRRRRVRRARAEGVPISSNKSMIGHTLTAAGAVEAVFTLLTIQNQRIPPTINYTCARSGDPARRRAERRARRQDRDRDFEFLRFRRAERMPGARGRAGLRCSRIPRSESDG